MTKKRKQILTGAIFTLVGFGYFLGSFSIQEYSAYAGSSSVSSAVIPQILGIFLMVLSLLELIKGIRMPKSKVAQASEVKPVSKNESEADRSEELTRDELIESYDDDAAVKGASTKSFVIIFGILIVYLALLKSIGFVVMSTAFMIATITAMSPKEKHKWLTTIILSIAVSVSVYVVFVYGLDLVLPQGIMPF